MRRRKRAQKSGLRFERPAIVAGLFGGGVGGWRVGHSAKLGAGGGAGRARGVGAGHRGRMTREGGVGKGGVLGRRFR